MSYEINSLAVNAFISSRFGVVDYFRSRLGVVDIYSVLGICYFFRSFFFGVLLGSLGDRAGEGIPKLSLSSSECSVILVVFVLGLYP